MATLYAFYYVEKKVDLVLLYAYTDDKVLAKAFRNMRSEKALRMVKKKFRWEDVNDEIFYDSLVKEIYNKHSTRFRTKKIEWHPLTDGVNDYQVPLTYTEVTEITAMVQTIEDMAMENLRCIEKSILQDDVKQVLKDANSIMHHDEHNELYSVINTLKIFVDKYKHLLKI